METENPQSLAVKNGNQILPCFFNNLEIAIQSNELWISGTHRAIYLKSWHVFLVTNNTVTNMKTPKTFFQK